jgi:hypothetical protein
MLSQQLNSTKYSRTTSRARWFNAESTNVSTIISVPDNEDTDDFRNVGLLAIKPSDPVDSPRIFYWDKI